MLCMEPEQSAAGTVKLTEGQAKAAYLYNFAQYVEWPASTFAGAGSPLVITVLGKCDYPEAFESLASKTVRRRHLVVRQIRTLEELGDTHILFIGSSERGRLSRLLAPLKSSPVLTVSDIKQFAAAGGMVGLVPQEDRIGFEINLKAARRAELRLSALLLKLALTVLE